MGTSAKGSTKLSVDLRRWAIFAIWETEADRERFVENSATMHRWQKQATSLENFFLTPTASHGSWDGIEPFAAMTSADAADPIAVLTHSTVRWNKVLTSMRAVPRVDTELRTHDGCSFAIAMGEWPLGEQATFSIWDSADAIRAFAYQSDAHKAVMKRSVKESWNSDELFCRFSFQKV